MIYTHKVPSDYFYLIRDNDLFAHSQYGFKYSYLILIFS